MLQRRLAQVQPLQLNALPRVRQVKPVGALAQCNYGLRYQFRVAGVHVGQELGDNLLVSRNLQENSSSIVRATDAPLMPHQLKRVARRSPLGLARNGWVAGNNSSDLFIALSTVNPEADRDKGIASLTIERWHLQRLRCRFTALYPATVSAESPAIHPPCTMKR